MIKQLLPATLLTLLLTAVLGLVYPLAMTGAAALLRRNLLVYGVGGILLPFVGIKAIDLVVTALHLA